MRALRLKLACILTVQRFRPLPTLRLPSGTGKTAYVKKHLQQGLPDTFVSMLMTFSAQTSANVTQDIVDGKLDKRRRGIYGPPQGKRMVIFVDDLNMPQVG